MRRGMKGKDIVQEAMRERGLNQEEFSKKLGYATASGLANVLQRNATMKLTNLSKMLDVLGYAIVVVDKETGEVLGEIEENKERVIETEKREVLEAYDYARKKK